MEAILSVVVEIMAGNEEIDQSPAFGRKSLEHDGIVIWSEGHHIEYQLTCTRGMFFSGGTYLVTDYKHIGQSHFSERKMTFLHSMTRKLNMAS